MIDSTKIMLEWEYLGVKKTTNMKYKTRISVVVWMHLETWKVQIKELQKNNIIDALAHVSNEACNCHLF